MTLRPLATLLRITLREWWNDNTFRLAAALAFYTVFSLAPVVGIAILLAGIFFGPGHADEEIIGQIEALIGPQGGAAVRQITAGFEDTQGTGALIVAFATLILGSTMIFAELQSALNQIWDVKPDPKHRFWRSLLRSRTRSFALVLGTGFLLLVSLVLSAALSGAERYLHRALDWPWLWRGLHLLTSLIVVTMLFAMIYRYLPDVFLRWSDVAVGAIVTAVLFTAGKYLIGIYLGQFAIGSMYGAAGSFAVLLIWVYYSALICFFGAEFTQVYARRYGSRIRPEPHAVRIGEKTDRL
jgi:membrane protein